MAPQTVEKDLPNEGSITEGDDYDLSLTWNDADGNAIDITNYTFWLTVKDKPRDEDPDALIQTQVTSHTDPTNGKTTLTLDAADTLEIRTNKFYDVQYKKPSGKIRTAFKGTIKFTEGYTDAIS